MTPAMIKAAALHEATERIRKMPEMQVKATDDRLQTLADTSQALGIELALRVVIDYGLEIMTEELESLKK
jgi:myo-inositol catabolism protein IolC